MRQHHFFLAALLVPPLALSCAATDNSTSFTSSGSGKSTGTGKGSTGAGGASGTGTGTGGVSFTTGSSGGSTGTGGGTVSTTVYGHTATTLYKMDPSVPGMALTTIGDFDCIGCGAGQDSSMTDFAVNSAGDLWGVSENYIYPLEVMGSTVHCTKSIPLSAGGAKFYALSFAPVGVLDPMNEVLVAGDSNGNLWAIDSSGTATVHGNFGTVPANDGQGHTCANAGKLWELSGDIVFLANNGSPVGFATVRDCPSPPSTGGCNSTDTLMQINLSALATATTGSVSLGLRGLIVKAAGCNDPVNQGYGSMFGIAAWEGQVYGFSHDTGALVSINNNTGAACLISSYPKNEWDGAGVTTTVPIKPPPMPM
jgi:hypothetical protein